MVAGKLTILIKFPVVKSETVSNWTLHYFTPVASVLLFNVGDLMGRTIATWLQWPSGKTRWGRHALLLLTILRIGKFN